MSEKGFEEKIVILRFTSKESLRKFYSVFNDLQDSDLLKIGDNEEKDLYQNNQKKNRKETMWTKLGLPGLDQKKTGKPSLGSE